MRKAFMYIDEHDIEVNFCGVFLFNHWMFLLNCPRSVNEPPLFIALPHNLHGLPLNQDVPDRWLATLFAFARNPEQRIDVREIRLNG
jgi:hypothetical protein